MVWLRKMCMLSSHKDLRPSTESRRCVDSSEHYMDWNKHPVIGTWGLTNISQGWASPKVKQMWTFTILWLNVIFFIILLYVDSNKWWEAGKSWKEDLAREFEMKDLGFMIYFLGMEVWKGYEELFVSQGKNANAILEKFHIESSKPMETLVGIGGRKMLLQVK